MRPSVEPSNVQTGDAVEWLLAVEVLPVALRTPCLHTIPFVRPSCAPLPQPRDGGHVGQLPPRFGAF